MFSDDCHFLLSVENDLIVVGDVLGVYLGQKDLVLLFDLDLSKTYFSELAAMFESHCGAE